MNGSRLDSGPNQASGTVTPFKSSCQPASLSESSDRRRGLQRASASDGRRVGARAGLGGGAAAGPGPRLLPGKLARHCNWDPGRLAAADSVVRRGRGPCLATAVTRTSGATAGPAAGPLIYQIILDEKARQECTAICVCVIPCKSRVILSGFRSPV